VGLLRIPELSWVCLRSYRIGVNYHENEAKEKRLSAFEVTVSVKLYRRGEGRNVRKVWVGPMAGKIFLRGKIRIVDTVYHHSGNLVERGTIGGR
jgi:hypothetical protein